MPTLSLLQEPTAALVRWAGEIRETHTDPFDAARHLVRRLGVWPRGERAEAGFWAPEIGEQGIDDGDVFLTCYTPLDELDPADPAARMRFRRTRVPLVRDGEFLWGVISGMVPGRRDVLGTLYRVSYRDPAGQWHTIADYLAASIPFGSFAPAEYYDVPGLLAARRDAGYFQNVLSTAPDPDGTPRVTPPVNILQIHAGTASEERTLAGLSGIYRRIGEKIAREKTLTAVEQTYTGYDAIQLMPIEPTIEYESGPEFWSVVAEDGDEVTVELRRPDMTNWGYDVVISASSAINPVLLDSGRPDELLELLEVLHTFPERPIKLILDIVYGHIDNQALGLLNSHFFAGANMYGQNVNFRHPVVRAMLLEMQRRKSDYGMDGLRVDGAQDFKNWNPETEVMEHDDDYLRLMNDVEQEVAGVRYRPYMIFEDGRPWPRDDWELASSYREVTKQMPNVWQWGPLTFAHNTPFLFTFWVTKWWRIREMATLGREWITGCANHDTLRRGTQVPLDARVNTYLGDTLPEIFRKGYDNPAGKLFDYALMPGIPMDFINGALRAPWSFIRNTDERYGIKVFSEESRFLHWAVTPERYEDPSLFTRLKAEGFTELEELRRFLSSLDHAVQATNYDLDAILALLNSMTPPLAGAPFTVERLKQIAREWMDDVYDYCNVSHHVDRLDGELTAYQLMVREFRRARPWLMDNFRAADRLDYLHPTEGSVMVHGVRQAPAGTETVLFLANMEGAPCSVIPRDLYPDMPSDGWQVALSTPGLAARDVNTPLTLRDSEGVVFTRSA